MRYMALIYNDPELMPAPGSPEFGAMMQGYFTANATYAADGVLLGGEPLEDVSAATSLRIRGGETRTMDGPFAETREQLGGYFVVEAESMEEAIKFAELIPGAKFGTVEVRPMLDVPGLPEL